MNYKQQNIEYKKIKGFKGYTCNTLGQIFHNGKELKPILTPVTNYMQVSLYKDNKPHLKKWHRVIAKAFCKGKSRWNTEVHHLDGNKINNNSENLEWISRKNHRKLHAMEYINTTLDAFMVQKIRCARALNLTYKEIKNLFKLEIGITQIGNICNDLSFAHNPLKLEDFQNYLDNEK